MINDNAKKNTRKKALKIAVIAAVLTAIIISAILIKDLMFSESSQTSEQKTVTVTVSGKDILLNGSQSVSISELEEYLNQSFGQGSCTVALINDTKIPADTVTYNSVTVLLSRFGINEALPTLAASGATEDEK